MSITPLALHLERFRSFVEPTTFLFPQDPGLYFIQGVNEAEDRLEANGSGKTSLWEALCWVNFDKTSLGLRAGDVCNWDHEKGTKVEFDFLLDGDDRCVWTVTRTWGPNTWTLSHAAEYITDEEVIDLAKDPQNPVLARLRLAYEPFLHSVFISQGRQGKQTFLDMGKEAQARLFSDVMGLDAWVERAKRAAKRAEEQDAVTRRLESDLSRVKGALQALEGDDAGLASRKWEQEREGVVVALREDLAHLVGKRRRAKADLHDSEDASREARRRLQEMVSATGDRERWPQLLEAAEAEVRSIDASIAVCNGRLTQLDKREDDLVDPKGPCPLCGHALSDKDRAGQLRVTRDEADLVARNLADKVRKLKDAEEVVKQIKEQLREWDRAENSLRADVDDMSRDEAGCRRALLQIDKDMDRLEDHIEEEEKRTNPHAAASAKRRREVDELRQQEEDLQRGLDDSVRRASLFAYWSKGFKDIRLHAIAEALTELEVEVNSEATALGLVDWEMNFAVDRETQKGTVQRGFSVTVKSPASSKRPVPWEAWSGGESQRLRVAAQMGLADLVRARTGCDFPLEVWDEPTQGLSAQGLEDLFTALADRARREARIVFLVDHRAHAFGGFAGHATVTKDRRGSRILTSWDKGV